MCAQSGHVKRVSMSMTESTPVLDISAPSPRLRPGTGPATPVSLDLPGLPVPCESARLPFDASAPFAPTPSPSRPRRPGHRLVHRMLGLRALAQRCAGADWGGHGLRLRGWRTTRAGSGTPGRRHRRTVPCRGGDLDAPDVVRRQWLFVWVHVLPRGDARVVVPVS